MVVLQAESEVASINMLYGGGGTGKRVMTSSSSPGVSLMQEGISYMAGAEVPGLIVDVQRGGPGLGTIHVIALTAKAVNVHGYQYAEAVRPDDCIGCASCGIVCPDGCISVYRKKMED